MTEGTHFEVILRDGVPIREMEKDIHSAFSDGRYAGLPDTSGPVSIRIEVRNWVGGYCWELTVAGFRSWTWMKQMGPSSPGHHRKQYSLAECSNHGGG